MRVGWARALSVTTGLVVGCGVAGTPRPPGPLPPRAPSAPVVRASPGGFWIEVQAPTTDIDGAPLTQPVHVFAYLDQPRCDGLYAIGGTAGAPLELPRSAAGQALRLAARAGPSPQGPPSPAVSLEWTEPPPAPEPPLAFAGPDQVVQIAWLPPPPPATEVLILHNGARWLRAPAGQAQATHTPGAGTHRYRLRAVTPDGISAPSGAVQVVVP